MSLNFLEMRKLFTEGLRKNGNAYRDKYIFSLGSLAACKIIKSVGQSQTDYI
jgi:hypothetical protein